MMTPRLLLLWVLVLQALASFMPGVWAGEPQDSYWKRWRSRQRAELAALPRPAEPPSGSGSEVDRFLAAFWAKHQVKPPSVVPDRVFARRAYLDIIGLLPTPEQLDRFERDSRPDKRAHLVDALLADNQAYAEHWMSFWNDLLRNDEQTNIDGLRKPVTRWLLASLLENKPIDLFVAELLNPGKDGPDGYLKGVNWRGRVNASQVPPVQAAQNVCQVFLASSIKCASCHNSFINQWKLKDAYGMASFFSASNLEMARCDKPTGKIVSPRFMFPGLGTVPANADLTTRHQAVAWMVTRPSNPRFARTMVNRLWKRLLGRGIFEPVDEDPTDSTRPQKSHVPDPRPPDDTDISLNSLLNWLAHDLMSHDYDVKRTLRQILLSRVYQAPVAPDPGKEPRWRGPVERRMTSEQYLDGIAQVTDYWPAPPVMDVAVKNPHVRAWRHRHPDALASALGRPNREQVCTVRDEESSVLQALELTNGKALSDRLHEGTRQLVASDLGRMNDAGKVVDTLYLRAYGRLPSPSERRLALPMIGSPKDPPSERQANWEDLLWVMFTSPEFEFIR